MAGTQVRAIALSAIVLFTGAAAGTVLAADVAFQDFFTSVCAGSGTPTGELATRCAETGGGTGDGNLSGDSESSLNPSQTLSSNDVSQAVARSLSKETRERGERLREGESSLGDGAASQSFGRLSLLAHARGEWFDSDQASGGDPERGYDGDLWALEFGLDYRLSDRWVLGAMLAYEEMDSTFDRDLQEGTPFTPASDAGRMESESLDFIVFGSWSRASGLYLDGSFGYRSSEYTLERNSVFQESGRSSQTAVQTKGTPDGEGWWASFNLGRDWQRGGWSYGPYAGITFTSTEVDAYTETDLNGSGLNMEIDKVDRDSLLGHLGFRASVALSTEHGVWLPQIRLEWNHEFDDDPVDATTAFALDAAETQYGLEGSKPDRDYFNLGIGLAGVFPNGWMPFIDGEILFGYEDFDRYRLVAGLRKEF